MTTVLQHGPSETINQLIIVSCKLATPITRNAYAAQPSAKDTGLYSVRTRLNEDFLRDLYSGATLGGISTHGFIVSNFSQLQFLALCMKRFNQGKLGDTTGTSSRLWEVRGGYPAYYKPPLWGTPAVVNVHRVAVEHCCAKNLPKVNRMTPANLNITQYLYRRFLARFTLD